MSRAPEASRGATIDELLAQARSEGARAHAAWNDELFDRLATGPVTVLWRTLGAAEGSADRVAVVRAYLTLVREAIAAGYVGRPERTFLGHCLTDVVPTQLGYIDPAARVTTLARVWNLGEGLAREPAWLGQYVLSQTRAPPLASLERFLAGALRPALSPAEPSSWSGPFSVTVHDTRAVDDAFLPGEMTMCAPQVVQVRDRRREVSLAVLLRPGGESHLFGPIAPLASEPASDPPPGLRVTGGRVVVGGYGVALPNIGAVAEKIVARAGFLVASATDSQRLWIVESAA